MREKDFQQREQCLQRAGSEKNQDPLGPHSLLNTLQPGFLLHRVTNNFFPGFRWSPNCVVNFWSLSYLTHTPSFWNPPLLDFQHTGLSSFTSYCSFAGSSSFTQALNLETSGRNPLRRRATGQSCQEVLEDKNLFESGSLAQHSRFVKGGSWCLNVSLVRNNTGSSPSNVCLLQGRAPLGHTGTPVYMDDLSHWNQQAGISLEAHSLWLFASQQKW